MIDIKQLVVEKNAKRICTVNDLQIKEGERVLIHGENGSGKSTLLRVLAGLERNYTGRCSFGVPIQERVFVHQTPVLFRGTVASNVTYGLSSLRRRQAPTQQSVASWLEKLNLSRLADNRTSRLSGGERRRVALARAMILNPKVLLLDEPFADLDTDSIAAVSRVLHDMATSTIVFTSPTDIPNEIVQRRHRLTRQCNALESVQSCVEE